MKLESVSIAGRYQIFIALVLAFLQYLLDSKVNIESFSCLLLNRRNPRRFDFWNERQSLWKSVKRRREVASTFQRSSVETEKKRHRSQIGNNKAEYHSKPAGFFRGWNFHKDFRLPSGRLKERCQVTNGAKSEDEMNDRLLVQSSGRTEKKGGSLKGEDWRAGGVDYAEEDETFLGDEIAAVPTEKERI